MLKLIQKKKSLCEFLSKQSKSQLKELKNSLPKDIKKNLDAAKEYLWSFDSSKFETDGENEEEIFNNKTHLHHLCFAIYKINEELVSGHCPPFKIF